MEAGLIVLLGRGQGTIESVASELDVNEEFRDAMNRAREVGGTFRGGMGSDEGRLLYAICRLTLPQVVLETGTGHGFSSSYILRALEDNGKGELYSLDLHYRDGVSVPVGKEPGWAIPKNLTHRFNLVLGESTRELPRLLKELGTVDIFLHDSRHTYGTMIREYQIVWPHLREGGFLLSHDVKDSDAFLDFCDRTGRDPVVVGNVGCIRR